MNQFWQYWHSYFKPADCDRIIELAKTLPEVDGQIGHGSDNFVKDGNVRRSKLRWIPRFDSRFNDLFSHMENVFHITNKEAFGFDLHRFHEVQFTEYNANDAGHYTWHHDTTWCDRRPIRRKVSMVIQLSDPADYDGGNFELSTDDCPQTPDPKQLVDRGTIIVFPSFLRHRVTPVTRGVRYSLVTWMEGPYFR